MTDTMFNPRSCMECNKPLPGIHDDWMEGECESPTCGATHYLCPDCAEAAGFCADDEPTPTPEPAAN